MSTGHVSGGDREPSLSVLTEFNLVQPEYTRQNYLLLNGIDRPGIDKIIEKGDILIMLIIGNI